MKSLGHLRVQGSWSPTRPVESIDQSNGYKIPIIGVSEELLKEWALYETSVAAEIRQKQEA